MDKVTPFLWFDGTAEQAANFYVSIFKNAKITSTSRIEGAGPGLNQTVTSMTFEIEGRSFIAFNGGPYMTFSPAISLFIDCETQAEVDELWAKLSEGGKIQQCGWLTDKFGVTWQVVPNGLRELLSDPDRAKSSRAMQAMLLQRKLDIAAIKKAFDGL
jgi:predicted 3-demethylubiquinone-9 3-methyltransferase (glyoxalase superfamily)